MKMIEKTHRTRCGIIHYWISENAEARRTLVFLPGLTADHRLFDRQVEALADENRVLVWDAPGHAASWPFTFDFDLMDKARWLNEILTAEQVARPILVGQSMGGYVGQAYAQLFPEKLSGFVSIDSAPLERKYVTAVEIWLLKRMEPVYRWYPWGALKKAAVEGVACTQEGRALMREIISVYQDDQPRYAKLAGHGYQMLAKAMEADLPYALPCPAMLICGEKDHAGSCIRYNKAWHRATGIPLHWIPDAGHNSNTDQPERVNALLAEWIASLDE